MGDLYVHVRMKECCRKTLEALDKKKKARFKGGVLGVKSLFDALSEKTIDDAKAAIPGGAGEAGGKLEALTRAACEKICEKHAGQHDGKGETEEGGFWHDLGAAIGGKPAKKRAMPGAGAGANGVGGKGDGKALGGQGIADKAKAKAKEYKDNGVSYSMKEPFYPASKYSDCSHFVNDVLASSGVKADYVTTAGLPGSKQFTKVADPQPGDIILQPGALGHHGHMGIYTGINGSGKPLGVQMGEHGAKEVTWGEGGAIHGKAPVEYYRPVGVVSNFK